MSNIDWTRLDTLVDRAARSLSDWRAGAVRSRAAFAEACAKAGIITWAEAADWTSGSALPAVAQSYIAALPEAAQEKARFILLARETVRRTAPEIAAIQAILGVSDAQVDALFGYSSGAQVSPGAPAF